MRSHSSQAKILKGGAPLADEYEKKVYSVVVDNAVNDPDMFEITFADENLDIVTKTGLTMGTKVQIKVVSDAYASGLKLMEGKVTGIELRYEPSVGTTTVVRGFDDSHALFHGRTTAAYKNVSASDVAKKVAQRAGITSVKVDSSSPVHDHVTQAAATDWEFLQGLADEVGYMMGVVDGKLNFAKPPMAQTGPAPGTSRATNPLQLVLGLNLLHVRAAVSASEQVKDVKVRGWDPKQKRAVVGIGRAETGSTASGLTPVALASKTGNKEVVLGAVVDVQAAAESLAKSIANHIADASAEIEGVATGDPKLVAGKAISLGNCGDHFNGKYVLASTRHVIDDEGYQTHFTVSGRHVRSLYGLVAGGTGAVVPSPNPRINGVVMAIVTDANDPLKEARVKLKFPWLSDDFVTDWARTVQVSAGNTYGAVILPEVGDEVLVAFEHGDVRRPYVLGGLYNGKDKPNTKPGPAVDGTGKVQWRGLVSRTHQTISLSDKMGQGSITIVTGTESSTIVLNDTQGPKASITIGQGNIEVKAAMDVKINAANIELTGLQSVKITGTESVEIKGAMIKLN